jgi:sn-glycerol 3-phosphate transport system permease protein
MRFFKDVVLPLSRDEHRGAVRDPVHLRLEPVSLAAADRHRPDLETIVVGITKMIGTGDAQNDWNTIMATAVLAMLPPVLVVILMQRWFVKGLTRRRSENAMAG